MISLENVSHNYGGGALLSEVTQNLTPGSFHFLTGPSGAGKTTILKFCYGELIPTSGRVALFGQDSRSLSRDGLAGARERIGVVHQDCRFLDHLPLGENIALPLLTSGRDVMAATGDLHALMDWVGLSNHRDALPPSLSGGERQRAALARAVIMSPDVILADEPTGNLDWDLSLRLLHLLVELNRMGKAILVATHDLNLIRTAKTEVSARVLRISGRRLIAAGADL